MAHSVLLNLYLPLSSLLSLSLSLSLPVPNSPSLQKKESVSVIDFYDVKQHTLTTLYRHFSELHISTCSTNESRTFLAVTTLTRVDEYGAPSEDPKGTVGSAVSPGSFSSPSHSLPLPLSLSHSLFRLLYSPCPYS
eukprot:TRINITY_DN5466_c1_g1_i1.p1 TRINITY_DN5466_c1_g1~~TRINITY_DN5466_c1_g1_i1.p1  ORF type:complete len:136 (+),score=15.77 TRINITY_DN5466_c1_g1_i1:91-498(+)